ncbi:TetR/AcrR family transcriptional regulator [Amycolatopsis sp. Hca4]|uniref:TetR/AcrR family transcriptional regulator n=1 Tax=Amycolatopsis sp. Hca4 TaxID=2742131 RepID=UPI0015919ABD|nr:TetR family transcriptional regulator [Amycolatopsis sp. Hca4]QKV75816.1 TetR/AcrR family transcriptional regulator [Amycolatopsis sp. Hca4]
MPPYDREQTTRRIFDAAVREFAAEGIGGARIDRIAQAAESNKALIYSYFGNKEQLFAAVVQRKLTELAEAVTLRADGAEQYIGDLFDFMTAHPEVLRLVQHEACHYEVRDIPDHDARKAHYEEKVDAVRAAQQTGSVDPALEPRFVVMSLISLVSWYVAAPQIAELVVGDTANKTVRRQYRAHLVEMARRMLRQDESGEA